MQAFFCKNDDFFEILLKKGQKSGKKRA